MPIELSKEQYKTLLRAINVAGSIYGVMGDMVDKKYKRQSAEIDDLTDQILKYAEHFCQTEIMEKFENKNVFTDDYSNKILDDITEYDEYIFWDNLVRKLALKEMDEKYSPIERKKMERMEFLKKVWELEEKYYEITEKEGLDFLKLKK